MARIHGHTDVGHDTQQSVFDPRHSSGERFAPAQGAGRPVRPSRTRVLGTMRNRLGLAYPTGGPRGGARGHGNRARSTAVSMNPGGRVPLRGVQRANQPLGGGTSGPASPGRPTRLPRRRQPTTRPDLKRQFPNG